MRRAAPTHPAPASNMRRLSADPEWRFAGTPGGKAACLQHFRGLVSEIETKLDDYFDLWPKQPLKIQPVPPHMEEGSSGAFYMPPSLDGSETEPSLAQRRPYMM